MTSLIHIAVCRKPIEGTIAENCIKHGCGGLNIDQCRVGLPFRSAGGNNFDVWREAENRDDRPAIHFLSTSRQVTGRWPANIVVESSEEVLQEFPNCKTTWVSPTHANKRSGEFLGALDHPGQQGFNDSGSSSRFFFNFEES